MRQEELQKHCDLSFKEFFSQFKPEILEFFFICYISKNYFETKEKFSLWIQAKIPDLNDIEKIVFIDNLLVSIEKICLPIPEDGSTPILVSTFEDDNSPILLMCFLEAAKPFISQSYFTTYILAMGLQKFHSRYANPSYPKKIKHNPKEKKQP